MSNSRNISSLKNNLFTKITTYSKKASQLGHSVRHRVFGFRRRSSAHIDRWALPVKLLHHHRLLQRQRVFYQSGGHRSSIARHALKKARSRQQS